MGMHNSCEYAVQLQGKWEIRSAGESCWKFTRVWADQGTGKTGGQTREGCLTANKKLYTNWNEKDNHKTSAANEREIRKYPQKNSDILVVSAQDLGKLNRSLPERRAARAGRELEHALTTVIPTTGVHYRPDVSMKAVVLR